MAQNCHIWMLASPDFEHIIMDRKWGCNRFHFCTFSTTILNWQGNWKETVKIYISWPHTLQCQMTVQLHPLLMPHKITGCTLPRAVKDQLHIHQCMAREKLQNLYKTHTSLIIYNHVKFWKSSDAERVLQKLVWPSSEQLLWPPSKSFLTLSEHLPQPSSNLTIVQTPTMATFKIVWPSSKIPATAPFRSDHHPNNSHSHLQNHLTIIKDMSWIPSPLPDHCWYAYHSQLQSCRAMCCGNHARNQGKIPLLTPKARGDVQISCSAQTHTPTIEKRKETVNNYNHETPHLQ